MSLLSSLSKKSYLTFLITDDVLIMAGMDNSRKKLAYYQEYPLPPDTVSRNKVINQEILLKLLLEIKTKNQLDNKFVVLGISDEQCLTHTLTLPPLELTEIDQAIEYQADSFLPFPYKKECIDWMLVKTEKDGKKVILVNAIPLTVINDFINVFEKVNFHPVAFEATSLSLFRFLTSADRELCLALDVGRQINTLIFCKKGSILTTSLLYDQSQLPETLKKLLNYYLNGEDPPPPYKIYLTGNPLSESIVSQIKNAGFEIITLKSGLKNHDNQNITNSVILESLLKKQIEPPKDEKSVNIIPASQLEKYQNIFLNRGGVKIKRILISLLFFLTIVMAFAYFRLITQIKELQKTPINSIANLDTANLFRLYGVKAEIINRTVVQNKFLENVIQVGKNPPAGISILNISYDRKENSLVISGEAKTRKFLYDYKDTLEKMKIFKKVSIPISSLEKEVEIDYRIICKI